jgi:hypothetical protein
MQMLVRFLPSSLSHAQMMINQCDQEFSLFFIPLPHSCTTERVERDKTTVHKVLEFMMLPISINIPLILFFHVWAFKVLLSSMKIIMMGHAINCDTYDFHDLLSIIHTYFQWLFFSLAYFMDYERGEELSEHR